MRRIAVIGAGGAGKTVLANRLGDLLDLPVIHLDALRYDPGWNPTVEDDFVAAQRAVADTERWIMDGKPVDLGVPGALSLAWLVAPAWPGTTVTFNWTVTYGFVWAQTGRLQPGVTFNAQQTLPGDPDDRNANLTGFDYRQGAFTFVPQSGVPGALGSLTIVETANVPSDTAAVGIGMSNQPVFAVQAQPNTNLVFTPHPEYWISAGTFESGQVLDVEQITNEANLPFDNKVDLTAVLSATNVWTVS